MIARIIEAKMSLALLVGILIMKLIFVIENGCLFRACKNQNN